ncbi:MAG: hypothetical protein WBA12_09910 [Catalinimonas sp.]
MIPVALLVTGAFLLWVGVAYNNLKARREEIAALAEQPGRPYDVAVRQYNELVRQMPTRMVARWFGFREV